MPILYGDRLVGMITDRDIAVRGVAKGHGPDTPVRELMTDRMYPLSLAGLWGQLALRGRVRRGPGVARRRVTFLCATRK